MHRPLVTPLLTTLLALLIAFTAGCGAVNPLTGITIGGGVPVKESQLLGTPLPAGMEFYREHSRLEGQEGTETLRGDASVAACASMTGNALLAQGWTARLAQATQRGACYAFEKDGLFAVITIVPQAPTSVTLMTVYVSSHVPAELPLPSAASGLNKNAAAPQPYAGQDAAWSSEPISTAPLSTAPLSHEPAPSGADSIVSEDL